jgi:hypothetical protein
VSVEVGPQGKNAEPVHEDKRECRYHSYHRHHVTRTRSNRWFAQRYNVNNAWNFNGNNRMLNNNNVNNTNQAGAVTKLSEKVDTQQWV